MDVAEIPPAVVVSSPNMTRVNGMAFLKSLRENAKWQSIPMLGLAGAIIDGEKCARLLVVCGCGCGKRSV